MVRALWDGQTVASTLANGRIISRMAEVYWLM